MEPIAAQEKMEPGGRAVKLFERSVNRELTAATGKEKVDQSVDHGAKTK